MNEDDYIYIMNLVNRSTVEYGGSLKLKNGKLHIDKIYKGIKYSVDIKDKNSNYLFHIHTKKGIKDNCGYSLPSFADIQKIVDDKINFGVLYHFIFTPDNIFIIESKRTSPLKDSNFANLCEKLNFSNYQKYFKNKNIIIRKK